jgi:hypothetical protein
MASCGRRPDSPVLLLSVANNPSHSGGTAPDLHRIPLPPPPSMMSHPATFRAHMDGCPTRDLSKPVSQSTYGPSRRLTV